MEATVPNLLMLQKYFISKQKKSGKKDCALCLGNISNGFTIYDITKTGLKGSVKFFSIDFNPLGTNDTFDIHKYLMKRT